MDNSFDSWKIAFLLPSRTNQFGVASEVSVCTLQWLNELLNYGVKADLTLASEHSLCMLETGPAAASSTELLLSSREAAMRCHREQSTARGACPGEGPARGSAGCPRGAAGASPPQPELLLTAGTSPQPCHKSMLLAAI